MWNKFKYFFGLGVFWLEYPHGGVSSEMSWESARKVQDYQGGIIVNE